MDDFENEQILTKKSVQLHNDIDSLISKLESLVEAVDIASQDKQRLIQITTTKINLIINEFETNPKLLDSHLQNYITQLCDLYLNQLSIRSHCGEIVYNLAKIRQMKNIILYFPSDLYLINKILSIVTTTTKANEFITFFALLWICNLSLLPFPLNSIDKNLSITIYKLGIENLHKYHNGSKNQIASLILLSKLLTRNDCSHLLQQFFQNIDINNWVILDANSKLSYYLTVNKLLKSQNIVGEDELLKINQCINNDLLQLKSLNPSNLNVLYLVKIFSKLALNYISRGDFSQVQSIINNLINDILLEAGNLDYNLRYCIAKALSNIVDKLSNYAINYQQQLIEFILSNLDITDDVSISKNHTILLTLGYLCLNKTMSNQYIGKLLNIVHATMFIKIRTHSQKADLGNCIRDSSCFITWAIIKNQKYQNELLETTDQLTTIFTDLIKLLIFDQELLLKKCSIAVLQELIGRYGQQIFQNYYVDKELLGAFIINFMESFSDLRLKQKCITFEMIDLMYDKIDLKFLLPNLLDEIYDNEDSNDELGLYLHKLLTQQDNLLSVVQYNYNLDEIKLTLIDKNRLKYLYDLPKVPYQELSEKFSNFNYHDNSQLLSGYLTFLLNKIELTDLDWENLFQIIKLNDGKFDSYIGKIIRSQNTIPKNSILHLLMKNNVTLSTTIFNFQNWSTQDVEFIVNIIKNPNIDIEIRRNLIYNINDNYTTYPIIEQMYLLFDDYTLTVQGDIGSKLRLAMVELVQQHNLLNDTIKSKLIRLSGEIIDKIRLSAFQLLVDATVDGNKYWQDWFEYYNSLNNDYEKIEFWKGSLHTIGSFKGDPKIINDSFTQLLNHGPKTNDFNIWLKLLDKPKLGNKESSRDLKLKLMILQTFLKLFQANYNFNNYIDYNELYEKCYQLYLNGGNINQISIILQIFYYIAKKSKSASPTSLTTKINQQFTRFLKAKYLCKLRLDEIFLQIILDKNGDLQRYEQIEWNNLNASDITFIRESL